MSCTILIQKGLTPELYEKARLFASDFKLNVENNNGSYARAYMTGGGYSHIGDVINGYSRSSL